MPFVTKLTLLCKTVFLKKNTGQDTEKSRLFMDILAVHRLTVLGAVAKVRRSLRNEEGVSTVFAKQASKKKKKKKIELHVDCVRCCAPLGPAANRLELDRAAQGLRCQRVRRTSPSNAL